MNMHGHPNNSQAKEQKPVPGKQHRDQLWKYLKQLIRPICPIRRPITTTIIISISSLHQLNYTIIIILLDITQLYIPSTVIGTSRPNFYSL